MFSVTSYDAKENAGGMPSANYSIFVLAGLCAGFYFAPVTTTLGVAWEYAWWLRRRMKRRELYTEAQKRAIETKRKLVVIGDPGGGLTHNDYGIGDLCVDITGCSAAPISVVADISTPKSIPVKDNSVIVYVSCVLEYVKDFDGAVKEVLRVAGSPENVFVVRVEPWTAASVLYPGAKRTVSENGLSVGWSL